MHSQNNYCHSEFVICDSDTYVLPLCFLMLHNWYSLEVYVSQLDLVGPHLPLLRPHLPLLLKHNRIKILSPHVGKLFAKGYQDLSG